MVSKTSLTAAVRELDWKTIGAALDAEPNLIRHRDERGRNWLHLCWATPLADRAAKATVRIEGLGVGAWTKRKA